MSVSPFPFWGVLDVGRIAGFGGAGVLLFDEWWSGRFEGW